MMTAAGRKDSNLTANIIAGRCKVKGYEFLVIPVFEGMRRGVKYHILIPGVVPTLKSQG